ncbi:hypothetical protein FQR65_LT16912 [Abscondita terminalis]|nr:hypothetical protein FQR65_LT16912 [Abscondita terminalis]
MDTLNSEDLSSSWSFVTEYDLAKESRLLNFDNASNEKLINSSCYKLDYDDEGKYFEIGYSTYLELTPVIRIWNSLEYKGVSSANGPHNVHCNDQEKNNVLLTIDEWKVLMGLQDHLMNEFFYNSVNDEYQELVDINDGLVESISSNISKDVQIVYNTENNPNLSDSKWDVDCMFGLKDIINYRLELMQSYKLDTFYNYLINCVVIEQRKKKETEEDDDDDGWGVYDIYEKLLNTEYNINSHNVLCLMEILYYRPGFIMSCVVENSVREIMASKHIVKFTMISDFFKNHNAQLKKGENSYSSGYVKSLRCDMTVKPPLIKGTVSASMKKQTYNVELLAGMKYSEYHKDYPTEKILENFQSTDSWIDELICELARLADTKFLKNIFGLLNEENISFKFKPTHNPRHDEILTWLNQNISKGRSNRGSQLGLAVWSMFCTVVIPTT